MTDRERAVRTVLEECLAVRSGERVLVVTDPNKVDIARALVETAREIGAEAVILEMSERASHGSEPPDQVAAAMLESDVVVAPTSKSLSHTDARHKACIKGARIATMPGITEDMLVRTMGADYGSIRRRSLAMAEALTAGESVRISSGAGTDVSFVIAGRNGISDDGDLAQAGAFGNLPAGEGFIAPVEGKTKGRIVFDGSVWPIGKLSDPLVADIEDGYARFSGPAAATYAEILEPHGRDAFAVAELGIGTNEAARLTGNVLEDEKILGTIHVAFGDNHSFGGTIRVQSHQDGVVLAPTVEIDGRPVMTSGRMLI